MGFWGFGENTQGHDLDGLSTPLILRLNGLHSAYIQLSAALGQKQQKALTFGLHRPI